jgi:Ino eighty subunit 1
MRAQLRTYHAIPSLQAHQDPHAYKQLQDAPRLKSILKGGAEDRSEPPSFEVLKGAEVPRTNPVNLLFVICNNAIKVAELHFPPGREFHDLIMRTNLSSETRAKAFLWIMWFYLESDFTEEGCDENPFGRGVDYGVDVANQGVPRMHEMTAEEEEAENVDPQEEIDFGFLKKKMRAKIIEADQQYAVEAQPKRGGRGARAFIPTAGGVDEGGSAIVLPRIRPSKHESDIDSTRSTPPPRALARHRDTLAGGSGRRQNPLKYQMFDPSSPGGPPTENVVHGRKPRPPTAHQIAVERNRQMRVDYLLDRGLRREHHRARKSRKAEGAILRAWKRIQAMGDDAFEDSDGEREHYTPLPASSAFRERGIGGLTSLRDETDDYGEEVTTYMIAVRRVSRRLDRWARSDSKGVVAPVKRPRVNKTNGDYKDPNETEEEPDPDADMEDMDMSQVHVRPAHRSKANGRPRNTNGDIHMEDADGDGDGEDGDLDDVDKELIGMADGVDEDGGEGDGDDDDQELDDVERTLLGMGSADEDSD